MALFGEKYGDRYAWSRFPASARSCAAARTSTARAISASVQDRLEGSISAGVRRIEAITGEGALDAFRRRASALARVSDALHTRPEELVDHVEKLVERQRAAREAARRNEDEGGAGAGRPRRAGCPRDQGRQGGGHGASTAWTARRLRALVDSLRNKWKTAVVVLAATEDGNVSIVSAVTKDLTVEGARG